MHFRIQAAFKCLFEIQLAVFFHHSSCERTLFGALICSVSNPVNHHLLISLSSIFVNVVL